ncbi:hypothetical protein PSHT_10539 [Puccinia striiformis]|uniref:Uncharacterized protein n=1 Tax=Puccinia striiformis TaxID=27350 RepID=A0A2S4V906_9BASI|nr:hypothetical protein PSHT_10539 [Puccinia striiformis]
MSYSSRPISSSSHSNSTATTPKQRHLAHLATKLAELSIQTDRLASLCKVNARQHTDQHELAIYYGSMLMATTRVFNLVKVTDPNQTIKTIANLVRTNDGILFIEAEILKSPRVRADLLKDGHGEM